MLTTTLLGRNFINGQWVEASTHDTFLSLNPADRTDVIGEFTRGTPEDVEAAVAAAKAAYPKWRAMSRIARGECFDRFAELAQQHLGELTDLLAHEAGKPLNEARADVVEGIHMAQYVFGSVRMPHGDVVTSEIPEKDLYVRRRPKGVVAVITPWNFPFAVPMWLLGPSLVEGNTAVFKPSEETPMIGQRMVELFEEAGFPPGVINLVQGTGPEVGDPLARHPDVKVVLFTGSYEVGSQIKRICAAAPDKMAVCEMGSKSAVIVCDDARLDLAVNASILSAFKTAGQRCVSAGRLIVQRSILPEFADEFVAAVRALPIGDPRDPDTFLGPLINEDGIKKVLYYNNLAKAEGADVLLDSKPLDEQFPNGNFVGPFVYRMEHRPGVRCIREEVFGPHVALVPFDTLDEAIEIYNDTEYGLSCAVITEDFRNMRRVREECEFGLGYVNAPCIGAEVHLPFGGLKKSGVGLPSASALIDAVTHRYAWTVNYGEEIKMAQGLDASVRRGA
jgi:aldehyde dehydrogenase (NAD+)